MQQKPSLDASAAMQDPAALADWLLAELADGPPGPDGTRAWRHLQAMLHEACGGPEAVLQLVRDCTGDPRNRRVLQQAREERQQGRHAPYILNLAARNGLVRLRCVPRPLLDARGHILCSLAAVEDVTASLAAQEAARADQEKFRLLCHAFPFGICVTDAEGRIVQANAASERILGIPMTEQTNRSIDAPQWRIIRPDGSPMPAAEFASVRALTEGRSARNEDMGVVRPGGAVCWIDVMAAPLALPEHGVVIVFTDVSRRRQGEEALRHKERRYRLAVEAGKVCVWEWDKALGRVYLDPMFPRLLGYSPEEIGSQAETWLELIHPEDRPSFVQALDEHQRRGTPYFEHEHRVLHKDGSQLWILSRGVVGQNEVGELICSGSDMDITDRKSAELALEQERGRLYNLLDRLPAFFCLLGPEGGIRFANRVFHEAFAAPAARAAYDAMHAPREQGPGILGEIFETRSLSIWEWECAPTGRFYRMYGYPFQESDGTLLVLELGMDITNSKKALEALRRSEERYRSIAENLALGLGLLDKDLRLRAVNPRLQEWLPHLDFSRAPHCYQAIAQTPDGGPCPECPVPALRRDGMTREVLRSVTLPQGVHRFQVTYSPMFEPGGEVESVLVLVEDVTEKLEVQDRLQQARKLQALGTLAGGIAHEINQPLNALQLYVSGLEMLIEKDRQPEPATLLTRLGWIMRETRKIHEIITHMRALVHQEAGPAKPVAADLNACVQDALSLLQAQLAAHGIRLQMEFTPDLPLARANPVQMEQVTINLVVNAMQALDSMERPDKLIRVVTGSSGGQLRLVVRDNGPGLQGLEDRMFDPFFTSKDAGKGMGLGLSIVHTFVDSWGGSIQGRTLEAGGAEFLVLLLPAP